MREFFILPFSLVFTALIACSVHADQTSAPEDEQGILTNGNPVEISSDTSALAGSWGKCLKSVDTRCYFMSVEATGRALILTYISRRDKQFGEDPADKPHCYNATERELAKIGEYTYIWQDGLASNSTVDPDSLMKIVVEGVELLLYSGDKLQLSLPAVSQQDISQIVVCK